MKKDSTLYKVVLLSVLCAACGLLLSAVNDLTAPVIAANSLANELANLEQIYPGATFTEVSNFDDPTGAVIGAYEAEGTGFVYKCKGTGYASDGFTYLVAFSNDGEVDGFAVLAENETSGFGKRCFEEEYVEYINSLTASDEVDTLSGATLTSTAIKNGFSAAAAVFNAGK